MTARVLLLALAAAIAPPATAATLSASPRSPEPQAALVAPDEPALRERVAQLVSVALQPGLSPERQAARDVLFREIRPLVLAHGHAAGADDALALRQAIARLPCASGSPRLVRTLIFADVAFVAAAGEGGGGCTYLLRRDGSGWSELLPLGWTLQA